MVNSIRARFEAATRELEAIHDDVVAAVNACYPPEDPAVRGDEFRLEFDEVLDIDVQHNQFSTPLLVERRLLNLVWDDPEGYDRDAPELVKRLGGYELLARLGIDQVVLQPPVASTLIRLR